MARYRWDTNRQAWLAEGALAGAVDWNEVDGKPSTFPPDRHAHDWTDLPTEVLGRAVGTDAARPNAGMVLWFAAAEPPAMLDGDVLIISPIFG